LSPDNAPTLQLLPLPPPRLPLLLKIFNVNFNIKHICINFNMSSKLRKATTIVKSKMWKSIMHGVYENWNSSISGRRRKIFNSTSELLQI
jgi:hypothetical protein